MRAGRDQGGGIMSGGRKGMIHFCIAAGILVASIASWNIIISILGGAMVKESIPWPRQDMAVDGETFRLVTFPQKIGRFQMDDSLTKDGKPCGETIFGKDLMNDLKMGTYRDRTNLQRRASNWYVAAYIATPPRIPPAPTPTGRWKFIITQATPTRCRTSRMCVPRPAGRTSLPPTCWRLTFQEPPMSGGGTWRSIVCGRRQGAGSLRQSG